MNYLGNRNDYVYYSHANNLIIFYFSDYTITSLLTHFRIHLTLSQNNMINNVKKFSDLKIRFNNNNKLIFDIYNKRTDFSFRVNTFKHYN